MTLAQSISSSQRVSWPFSLHWSDFTNQLGIKKMTLKLPENVEVQEYLRLSGVFGVMRDLVKFGDPQPEDVIPERPPVRPMVPCSRFDSEHDIDQLANQMEECFWTEPVYGSIFETCHTAFSELATNVVSHAESEGGYVLAQQYNYRSGPKVEIAVADCGMGIQASLQKNQKHTSVLSDADAIELAIKAGSVILRRPPPGLWSLPCYRRREKEQ